jgi:hypothetical protein
VSGATIATSVFDIINIIQVEKPEYLDHFRREKRVLHAADADKLAEVLVALDIVHDPLCVPMEPTLSPF